MNRSAKTKLNLVAGKPIAHSMSPLLHNSIYAELAIDTVMVAVENAKADTLIAAIKTLGIGLTAVTMPLKQEVITHMDQLSPAAEALGAVNTIINRDNKLLGHNTDVNGIAYALRKVELSNKNVLILGAGGGACALGYYLKQQSSNLYWLNRTKSKAENLAKIFGGTVVEHKDLASLDLEVIINATPLGMFPNSAQSSLPDYAFKPHQVVFDMIYNPINTLLLQQAEQAGAKTISGLDMFVAQGLAQITLWKNIASIDSETINKMKAVIKEGLGK